VYCIIWPVRLTVTVIYITSQVVIINWPSTHIVFLDPGGSLYRVLQGNDADIICSNSSGLSCCTANPHKSDQWSLSERQSYDVKTKVSALKSTFCNGSWDKILDLLIWRQKSYA